MSAKSARRYASCWQEWKVIEFMDDQSREVWQSSDKTLQSAWQKAREFDDDCPHWWNLQKRGTIITSWKLYQHCVQASLLCSLWGSRQSCWAVNLLHATAPIYQVVEFFFLLELCFCNAPVIWKAKSAHRISAEKFRLHVVRYLLEGYESGVSQRRGNRTEEPPQKGWC